MSKLAFLFPGQGSQYIGMGQTLYESDDNTKNYWDKASEILGYDIANKVFNGTDEELKDTALLQPALFLVSYSVAKYLESKSIVPDFIAGHSLGEYSAVAFAELFSFEEAVDLISFRGKIMKEVADKNPGSMAAIIGMDFEELNKLCSDITSSTGKYVGAANFNSPSQIVISGYKESVSEFIGKASEIAKKIVELPVSGAFHSPLMEEAQLKLSEKFNSITFKQPKYNIAMNSTGKIESDLETIKQNLLKQTTGCVLWTNAVKELASAGVNNSIEAGPGKVLRGLLRSITRDIKVVSLEKFEDINKYLEK